MECVPNDEGSGGDRYKIGQQIFPDMPSLLNFYKNHYLESTALIKPAPKKLEKVVAKFDFVAEVLSVCLPHFSKTKQGKMN